MDFFISDNTYLYKKVQHGIAKEIAYWPSNLNTKMEDDDDRENLRECQRDQR